MATLTTTSQDPNSPAWRDPLLHKWAPQREQNQHVIEGTAKIQEQGETYLPKMPRESVPNYQIRRYIAVVVNMLAGAIRAAEGLITANPPKLVDGVSAAFTALWANVDGMQTGGAVWLRGIIRKMIGDGWCLVLVSTPVKAGKQTTNAEVAEGNLRPYAVIYNADSVMSPRFVREGGKLVLSQLILLETVREVDGLFGMKDVEQYRVLQRLAKGQHVSTIMREGDGGKFVVVPGSRETIETDELPVVEFSSNPTAGFGQAPPALQDLCDLTLLHYRTLADRLWAMRCAAFPWFVRIGYVDDGGTTVGPSEAIDLPIHGDAKFIAPPDSAFAPTQLELEAIERRGAAMSMSFLSGEAPGAKETATAVKIDQQGQDASLGAMAVSLLDSLNRFGAICSEMMGEPVVDTYFTMQTSFRGLVRDPAYLNVLVSAWKDNGLPLDALLFALKNGELPEDFDAEEEALRAVAEADAKAQADQQRMIDTGQLGPDGQPLPQQKMAA